MAQNYKMASLTQALVIDLTGQVCADQFRGEFYGGVSTLPDFHRGAARAREGKPIVCLNRRQTTAKSPASGRLFSQVKASRWHARMCTMW